MLAIAASFDTVDSVMPVAPRRHHCAHPILSEPLVPDRAIAPDTDEVQPPCGPCHGADRGEYRASERLPAPQFAPSHHRCQTALSMPIPKMSRRFGPQATAWGGDVRMPPSDSSPPQFAPSYHVLEAERLLKAGYHRLARGVQQLEVIEMRKVPVAVRPRVDEKLRVVSRFPNMEVGIADIMGEEVEAQQAMRPHRDARVQQVVVGGNEGFLLNPEIPGDAFST